MSVVDDTTSVVYKEITRFVGYRFGSDGSIWTRYRGGQLGDHWVKMSPATQRDGRLRVDLRLPGQKRARHYLVHRLILEAFAGPCPPGMECRHFPDRDFTNNRIENLSWGTKSQNQRDRMFHGTDARGERNKRAKLTEAQVMHIKRELREGVTAKELAIRYGVCQATVSHICTGRLWSHLGDPITFRKIRPRSKET